jgi:hypothetical protein
MVLRDDRDATIIWVLQNRHRTAGSPMRWSTLRALALGLALVAAGNAGAQPLVPTETDAFAKKPSKPRLHFEVTVLHASPSPGGVDPGAERFDRLLRDTVRYESLRVLKAKQRNVKLNEVEKVSLPTGQDFRFRPIDAGDRGVLVSVDWRKAARGDFRLPRQALILGGQPYEDGQLVVILEAE